MSREKASAGGGGLRSVGSRSQTAARVRRTSKAFALMLRAASLVPWGLATISVNDCHLGIYVRIDSVDVGRKSVIKEERIEN